MLLNCHTYYSFKYGTYAVKQLLADVFNKGYRSFALTDINNTSAVLEALRLTDGKPLNTVPGIDFRNGVQQCYVGIAQDNEGFRELNEHLSRHLHHQVSFDDIAPEFNRAFIIYPFRAYKGWRLKANEFIGVSLADLRQLPFSPYGNLSHKLVALHEVSFKTPQDFNVHRLLRAIDTNNLLSRLPLTEQARGDELLLSHHDMVQAYAAFPAVIANTESLLNSCKVTFDFGKLKSEQKKLYGKYVWRYGAAETGMYQGIGIQVPHKISL